jgi:hypothetical protein
VESTSSTSRTANHTPAAVGRRNEPEVIDLVGDTGRKRSTPDTSSSSSKNRHQKRHGRKQSHNSAAVDDDDADVVFMPTPPKMIKVVDLISGQEYEEEYSLN